MWNDRERKYNRIYWRFMKNQRYNEYLYASIEITAARLYQVIFLQRNTDILLIFRINSSYVRNIKYYSLQSAVFYSNYYYSIFAHNYTHFKKRYILILK